MTFRTLASALVLCLLPALASAAGCSYDRKAMSCADGSVYDSAAGKCVVSINS